MKRIILAMIISLASTAAMGQRYYTLQECGGDALKYIEKNYQDNPQRYIGKTVKYFVDECEVTIWDFVPYEYIQAEGGSDPREGKIIGIYFVFYRNEYAYSVNLSFAPPYNRTMDSFDAIEDPDMTEYWKGKFETFFKDFVISKILVNKEKNGKSISRSYRRP